MQMHLIDLNPSPEDYDALFAKLKNGEVSVIRSINVTDPSGNATAEELTSQLNLNKVVVTTR